MEEIITTYIASDGTVFFDRQECIEYEQEYRANNKED